MKQPRVSLVLGGGGSRGLAHVGVLQVLKRANIPIDFIVGTSMGGIVGALFALGHHPNSIAEQMILQMEGSNLLNFNLFSARSRQRGLQEQLYPVVGDKTFADLDIPLTLMAVDMVQGCEVKLSEGALMPALLATSAVPAVFPPVEVGGRQLSDGGVIDSLATHIAYEQGADLIIAVDVYPALQLDQPWADPLSAIAGLNLISSLPFNLPEDWERIPSALAAMWRASRVQTWHLHQQRLKEYPPDVLLRPLVDDYGSLDFKDVRGPLEAGASEAERHLPAIQMRLNKAG